MTAVEKIVHEPGIYFNLDEPEYHADDALGSSRVKAIAVDPYEAQFDYLYGEDKDTDALIFGSALHARLLEGTEALNSKFCPTFDRSKLEGALDTIADLKEFLDKHGQEGFSSKSKAPLIKMVQDIAPDQLIVEVEKRKWEEANAGKTPLSPKRWAQVEVASRWVQRDPLLSAVMESGTFIEGAPEVSVFYEDRGVRLKARFDRLLRHAIVDLKSFAAIFGGPVEQAALKAINRFRYDLQCADYLRAWERARTLFSQGKVFGEEPYDGFLAECFDRPEPKWIWIMIKSTGAPQPLVIDWQADMARKAAAEEVEAAIDTFIRLREEHGMDAEWPPMRPALTVTDTDLPTYFGRG